MNLSGVWLPFFWIFVGSCCMGYLLPDALNCLVSRAEVAQWGWGEEALAPAESYVGISYLISAAAVSLEMRQCVWLGEG